MAGFFGDETANDLSGTAGEDQIRGFQGNDILRGLGGDDHIYDGFGNDLVLGGQGDDVFYNVGGAEDTFDGGAGFDILFDDLKGFGFEGTGDVIVNFVTGEHKGTERSSGDLMRNLEGYQSTGTLAVIGTGDSNANLFITARGADTLSGAKGNDTLDSGAGRDRLFGGNGADELIGGKGADTVTGGKGADTFVFEAGDGKDRITDFNANQDTLALDVALYTIGESFTDFLDRVATDTGRNVVLDLGSGDRITLTGVRTIAELEDAIDFI